MNLLNFKGTNFLSIVPNQFFFFRCWDQAPNLRPSMNEIVRIMKILNSFFTGYDDPIIYPEDSDFGKTYEVTSYSLFLI